MTRNDPQKCAPTMLIVDDDPILLQRLARAFRGRGFEVSTASRGSDALALVRAETPEYVVLDLRMPDKNGMDVLKEIRALDEATRILVLTGYGSIATAVEATHLGAVGYLPKPADADEILAAFSRQGGDTPVVLPETPSLARAEWEHIQRVLADTDGNVSETARRLGIHRRSLQRKLQKYPPHH